MSIVNDTVLNCTLEVNAPYDYASRDYNDLPAWGWVLISLGSAAFVLIAIFIFALKIRPHLGRKASRGDAARGQNALVSSSPPLLTPQSALKKAPSDENWDINALVQLRNAWRSRIGEVHGLEFQKLIGRGGFAVVFKAQWKGTAVAVKLVEHTVDDAITRQIQREAALSTSVAHPHIVLTYKVATVGLWDLKRLPHYVDVSAVSSQGAAGLQGNSPRWMSAAPNDNSSSKGESKPSVESSMPSEKNLPSSSTSSGPFPLDQGYDVSRRKEVSSLGVNTSDGELIGSEDDGLVATLIIMEYCDLGSACDALYGARAFWKTPTERDVVSLLRLLIDVSLGLDYLHTTAKLVHGDLKPANVLLKSSGATRRGWIAKLGDFGIARVLDAGRAEQSMDAAKMVGTHGYLSPEMLSTGVLTPASDVYSFGILMWEMFTALQPFKEVGLGQLAYTVVTMQQRPPLECREAEGMPAGYAHLMQRCWAPSGEQRPKFEIILAELRKILTDAIELAGPGENGDSKSFLKKMKKLNPSDL